MALNILIVDDSPVMRSFIRKAISLTGLDVGDCYEAGNGEDALRSLTGQWVDLILTDINMPEMNGEELIGRLEADDLLRSIPVIVVSTDATQGRVERLMTMGARGYVTKPFLPETLRDEVEKVLGIAHA
uniref:Response regulator n=1 Tax=Acidobacterium capsulatum TaxID=33075 RepID=A0A7V4XUQ5_9BACT